MSPSQLRECSAEELDALYRVLEYQADEQAKQAEKMKRRR